MRPQHTSDSCSERKIKFDLEIYLSKELNYEGQHLNFNSGHKYQTLIQDLKRKHNLML